MKTKIELIVILVLFMALMSNCNNRKKPSKAKITSVSVDTFKSVSDNRATINSSDKYDLSKIPADFPKDLIITDWGADVENGWHYFYSNGKYVYEYNTEDSYAKKYDIGTWKRDSLNIIVNLTKTIGYRGVGDNWIIDGMQGAAHPIIEHERYYNFEQLISVTKRLEISFLYFGYDNDPVDTTKKVTDKKLDLDQYSIKGDYRIASI